MRRIGNCLMTGRVFPRFREWDNDGYFPRWWYLSLIPDSVEDLGRTFFSIICWITKYRVCNAVWSRNTDFYRSQHSMEFHHGEKLVVLAVFTICHWNCLSPGFFFNPQQASIITRRTLYVIGTFNKKFSLLVKALAWNVSYSKQGYGKTPVFLFNSSKTIPNDVWWWWVC